MKLAIIGSRMINIPLEKYIPNGVTEIVTGGAKGVDTCARVFAMKNKIPLKEFLPEYNLYGKNAPLVRNKKIAEYSDEAIALWDGKSKGTLHSINCFKKLNKKITIYIIDQSSATCCSISSIL